MLIVFKLEMNAGRTVGANVYEIGSLFVNPLIGQSEPGVAPIAQMEVNLPRLNTIGFTSGFSGTEFIFDELRIGSTYADVTPVPEPTSLLLLSTAGAVLAGSRRRRKAA